MGDDLGAFIENLVKQGASDEEIDLLVKDFQSRNQTNQPTQQEPAQVQSALKTFLEQRSPLGLIPGAADFISNIDVAAMRGVNQGETADILTATGSDPNSDQIQELAGIQKQQQSLQGSPAYQKFTNAPSFKEGMAQMFSTDGPQILGELTVESLASLITHGSTRVAAGAATGAALGSVIPGAGTATGAGVGAIGGIGDSSLNLEYSGSILESLTQNGVDTTDPKSLKAAFSDKDKLDQIKQTAILKGVPIAIFDMASAGLAGSIAKKVGTESAKKILLGNVLEVGAQGALGGGGEIAGSLTAGQDIQPGAVLAEAFGELGPGSAEIIAGKKIKGVNADNNVISKVASTGDVNVDTETDNLVIEAQNKINEILGEVDKKTPVEFNPEVDAITEKVNRGEALTPSELDALDTYDAQTTQNIVNKPPTIKPPVEPTPVDESTYESIIPESKDDVVRAGKDVFNLDEEKSTAVADIYDRVVNVLAKRNNIPVEEQYKKLKFIKGDKALATQLQSTPGIKNQLDAFHGSPYQFDKFLGDHVGKGNQKTVLGWGLYFTNKEGIAKSYANKPFVTKVLPKFFGEFKTTKGVDIAKKLANEYNGDFEEYYKALQKGFIPKTKEINELQRLEQRIKDDPKEGKILYEVSLHKGKTPKDYDYMPWVGDITGPQRDKINSTLQAVGRQPIPDDVKIGASVYKHLTENEFEGDQKKASMFLLDSGIDGINSPATITRNPTTGEPILNDTDARAFVVFDENAVSIENMVKFQNARKTAKGAMRMTLDSQAIIYALTDPDVSTPLHELAHVFESVLTDAEEKAILEWTGQSTWTTETSEAFARGFEKYLGGGKAPNTKIQDIFNKFKEWLTDIYKGTRNNPLKIELNKPMKELYAKMLNSRYVEPKQTTKTNAVQERKTKKVPVGEPSGNSETVVEGKPKENIQKKETKEKEKVATKNEKPKEKQKRETPIPVKEQKITKAESRNQERLLKQAEKKKAAEEEAKMTREIKAYDSFHKIQKDRPNKRIPRLQKLADQVGEEFPKLLKKIEKEINITEDEIDWRNRNVDREPTVDDLNKISNQLLNDEDINLDDDYNPDEILFQEGDEKKPKTRAQIVNAIVDLIELREDINTKANIQDFVNKVNRGAIEALGENYVDQIKKRLDSRREHFKSVNKFQNNVRTAMQTNKDYNSNGAYRSLMKDFLDISYKDLQKSNRAKYLTGLIDLASNKIPDKKAFSIVQAYHATNKLNNIKALNFDFQAMTSKFTRWVVENGANPATLTSIIGKYNKKASYTLLNEIYGKLMNLATQADLDHKNFTDSIDKIANKYKTDRKDHVRAQMFGTAFATKAVPGSEEYWGEVAQNLDLIIDNANSKIYAVEHKYYDDQSLDEAKDELAIANELKKNILKEKKLPNDSKLLTEGQKALYDKFREFAESINSTVLTNTRGVWGAEIEPLNNYMPKAALGKTPQKDGSISLQDQKIIDPAGTGLLDSMNDPDYGDILAQRSGFTKPRTNPRGYYYDYNILSVARRWSKTTLFDIYVSNEVKTLNKLLNPKKATGIVDALGPQVVDIFRNQLRSTLGAGRRYSGAGLGAWKIPLGYVDRFATAVIGTSGQLFTQASSAIPASIITNPKGVGKALAVMSGLENGRETGQSLRQWLDDNGMGIQLRDILFERFQTVEDYNKSGVNRALAKAVGGAEALTTYILRTTDKNAARLVWFSAFFAEGGTMQNPTRDAVLAAERAVGLLQNMSNLTFAASGFKSDSVSGRVLAKMLYAFKSFALNAALNTYGSAYNLFNKNSDEAGKMFAANVAMVSAYHLSATYLVAPLYTALASAVAPVVSSIFDVPEPDPDDDDEDKNYSDIEDVALNTLWDLIFGQIMPTLVDAPARVLYNNTGGKYVANALHGTDFDEYDQYVDSPIYSKKDIEGALAEGTGLIGNMIEGFGGGLLTMAAMSEGQEEDKTKDGLMEMAATTISQISLVPFRGDIRKILETIRREIKTDKRQANENRGNFSGTGTKRVTIPRPVSPIQARPRRIPTRKPR